MRLSQEFKRFSKEIDFAVMYLAKEDDLSHWIIQIYPQNDTPLKDDLEKCKEKYGVDHICLHLIFPDDYPFTAPFIWIEYPTIRVVSGGWIMHKGVPCWELIGSKWAISYYSWTIVFHLTTLLESGARIDLSRDNMEMISETAAKSGLSYLLRCHPEWVAKDNKK